MSLNLSFSATFALILISLRPTSLSELKRGRGATIKKSNTTSERPKKLSGSMLKYLMTKT